MQPYTAGTSLWPGPRDTESLRPYSYAINDFLVPPEIPGEAKTYSRYTRPKAYDYEVAGHLKNLCSIGG